MTRLAILLVAGALAVVGCGDDDDAGTPSSESPKSEEAMKKDDGAMKKDDGAMKKDDAAMAKGDGTTITLGDSEFGKMLFDSKQQAIYIFEKDPKGETVCYDDCAEAWPPVVTDGEPVAGKGVDASLLGTASGRSRTPTSRSTTTRTKPPARFAATTSTSTAGFGGSSARRVSAGHSR